MTEKKLPAGYKVPQMGERKKESDMGITSKLTVYEGDEQWFTATVENGFRGKVRVNIAQGMMDSDKPNNAQRMDLGPEECRALAHLLLAAAHTADLSLSGN